LQKSGGRSVGGGAMSVRTEAIWKEYGEKFTVTHATGGTTVQHETMFIVTGGTGSGKRDKQKNRMRKKKGPTKHHKAHMKKNI